MPAKSIRIIVPFTPGSGNRHHRAHRDGKALAPARATHPHREPSRRRRGTIGAALVAKSEPDGLYAFRALLFVYGHAVHVQGPAVRHAARPDRRHPARFAAQCARDGAVERHPLGGERARRRGEGPSPARSIPLRSASAARLTSTQSAFRLGAGIETVNIPFKGSPEALTEIVTGRVDFYFCPVNAVLPLLKDGKLVALAVGSTKRSLALPELPTTLEAGVPGSDYNFWVGMFAPAKTPRQVVSRLYQETAKALRAADVREKRRASAPSRWTTTRSSSTPTSATRSPPTPHW